MGTDGIDLNQSCEEGEVQTIDPVCLHEWGDPLPFAFPRNKSVGTKGWGERG